MDGWEVVKISQSEAITSQELRFGEPSLVDIQDLDELAFKLLDSGRVSGHTEHAFKDTLESNLRGDRVKLLTFNFNPNLSGSLYFLAAWAGELLTLLTVFLCYVTCDGS